MRHALPLLASALLISGCASTAPGIATGRTYQVTWIDAKPLVERSHLTLTFEADGRAYGTGGCNHWFAGYGIEGEILRFSKIGSTRRACSAALMAQEARFFKALDHVHRWDVSVLDELRLWPAEGKPMRLVIERD